MEQKKNDSAGNATREEYFPFTIESLCEEIAETMDSINESVNIIDDDVIRVICKGTNHITCCMSEMHRQIDDIKNYAQAILLLRKKEKGEDVTLEDLMAALSGGKGDA